MILLINIIVMSASFLVICFMNDSTLLLTISCVFTIVCFFYPNRKSFFYSYLLALVSVVKYNLQKQGSLENIVQLPLEFVVFWLFYIISVELLRAFSYQTFNLLNISANGALIQIKEKAS